MWLPSRESIGANSDRYPQRCHGERYPNHLVAPLATMLTGANLVPPRGGHIVQVDKINCENSGIQTECLHIRKQGSRGKDRRRGSYIKHAYRMGANTAYLFQCELDEGWYSSEAVM
jgi:hypothetical protein